MSTIRILSGGAAMGLVKALEPGFTSSTGHALAADFGAVGGMRARIVAGEAVDLVILTDAIMTALAAAGLLRADTLTPIGGVETAIAVRNGDRAPTVTDATGLQAALLAADAIYIPDPQHATAGIHVMHVLDKLGLTETVRERLRPYPNGATAMAALAKAPETRPIGCTQVTEILATPGVMLVMALPPGFDLTTVYVAGVTAKAAEPGAAQALMALLADESKARLRAQCGFV